jgi:hypothetical protein
LRRAVQRLIAFLVLVISVYQVVPGQEAGIVESQGTGVAESPGAGAAEGSGNGAAGSTGAGGAPTDVEGEAEEGQAANRVATRADADARAQDLASAAEAEEEAQAQAPAAPAPVQSGSAASVPGSAASVPGGAAPVPGGATSASGGATTAATTQTAGGAGGALSWAPPSGWARYPVTRITATNSVTTVSGKGGDVLIQLSPDRPVAPIIIANCRNAVVMGGQINVLPTARIGGDDQRAIYVHKCTGTVHIEGVLINGAVAGSQSDGIAVNAPEAIVQIQNVRMEGLRGTYSVNHADVFQPWGGVREFRIDRLTGSTNYQGIQVRRDLGAIGRGTIRNANVASSEVTPIDRGGQFIRVECRGYPLALDNVYVAGRAGRSFGTSVWPQSDDRSCPAVIQDGVASWPSAPNVAGGVREGRPSSGDFVPAGSVGLGYVSPGYR